MDTNSTTDLQKQVADLTTAVERLTQQNNQQGSTIRSLLLNSAAGKQALCRSIKENDLEVEYFDEVAKAMGWTLTEETELTITVTYTVTVEHPIGSEAHLDRGMWTVPDLESEDSEVDVQNCYGVVDRITEGGY